MNNYNNTPARVGKSKAAKPIGAVGVVRGAMKKKRGRKAGTVQPIETGPLKEYD